MIPYSSFMQFQKFQEFMRLEAANQEVGGISTFKRSCASPMHSQAISVSNRARRRNRKLMSAEEKVEDNLKRKMRRANKATGQRTIFDTGSSPALSQLNKKGKLENLHGFDLFSKTNNMKAENCEDGITGSPVTKLCDLLKNLKTTDQTLVVLKAIMAQLTKDQQNQIFQEFGYGAQMKDLKNEVAQL